MVSAPWGKHIAARIADVARGFGVIVALLATALLALTADAARMQDSDAFLDALDDPAIAYRTAPSTDRVAQLARQLDAGTTTLAFDANTGFLPALLRALEVDVSSQLALFSKTSLQRLLISPQNPRVIYFNDAVMVAWPRGGFIELASHDPRQGVHFYVLPQQPGAASIIRRDDCLVCHHSYDTLGVPGVLARSVITGPRGESMPFLGNYRVDDRTPLEQRWAGWFVTGSSGTGRHLGNQMPPATRDVDAQVTPAASSVDEFPDALHGYLSAQSDIVAHLVFDHQMRATNLLTRAGWEVRLAQGDGGDVTAAARHGARDLVDALLYVDEAPLPAGLTSTSRFRAAFAARGPFDHTGRSLREFDLRARLMRYPCSFMIYSDAFDALPPVALDAVYRRLWTVLSGADTDPRYARVTTADRQAVVEILRDTKKGLPEYFKQP